MGAPFELNRCSVRIGDVVLFADGRPHDERAPKAAELLTASEVKVQVDLGSGGSAEATIWTCDLSAEYVKINAMNCSHMEEVYGFGRMPSGPVPPLVPIPRWNADPDC